MADKFELSYEAMGIKLPYSAEAEQAVIGAIIADDKIFDDVCGIICAEHFYIKQNADIFREMVLMNAAGKSMDFVTVLSAVADAGVFSNVEDAKVYLYNIVETVPTITNAVAYAKIVYDKYLQRSMITMCRDAINEATTGEESAQTLLDYLEQRIYEIKGGRDRSEMWSLGSVLQEVLDTLNKLSGADKDKYKGLPTGFAYLDKVLTGFNRSDLIILAARPGVGKTSIALNFCTNIAARREDVSIAFFSLEMTKQQLAQRILSNASGVASSLFRSGVEENNDWVSIVESYQQLSKTKLYLDDTSGITVPEIKSKARRIKNLGMIVVDYLQLMSGTRRNDSRVNEISEITRSFKIMAKELNVPIILLSQLSRSNEKDNRQPRLSDLRDSGSIEQDADIVLFLHRNALPGDDDNNDLSDVSLIVAKNRHGETTSIKLKWDGQHTRFTQEEFYLEDV